jgi:uncharacterized protein (DUF1778 family)
MTPVTTIRQSVASSRPTRKDTRLGLRLNASQRALLAEAAAVSDASLSEFVLRSATQAAREVLADRTDFVLPAGRWSTFVAALDRPPRAPVGLVELLATQGVLDDA